MNNCRVNGEKADPKHMPMGVTNLHANKVRVTLNMDASKPFIQCILQP